MTDCLTERGNLPTTKNNRNNKGKTTNQPTNHMPFHNIWNDNIERKVRFIEYSNIFPLEQKRCKKQSYDCKDPPLIIKMIVEYCESKYKNLSMAWIDFINAFDNVPKNEF